MLIYQCIPWCSNTIFGFSCKVMQNSFADWICFDFFIIIHCLSWSYVLWFWYWFKMYMLSWKWWLTYLHGFYSEPEPCSILDIFLDPNPIKCGQGWYHGTYWLNLQIDLEHIHMQLLHFACLSFCQNQVPISCWSFCLWISALLHNCYQFSKIGTYIIYHFTGNIAVLVCIIQMPASVVWAKFVANSVEWSTDECYDLSKTGFNGIPDKSANELTNNNSPSSISDKGVQSGNRQRRTVWKWGSIVSQQGSVIINGGRFSHFSQQSSYIPIPIPISR